MKPDLTINDIKQYIYCQRIIFFNHVMPVEKKPTFKMELGKIKEDELRALEKRRKLRRYDLDKGQRVFLLNLYSPKYGLSGKLDMLIITKNGYYPVDFKYTDKYPGRNHLYQLGGYALLIEDEFREKVSEGFIYLIPKNDVLILNLTDKLKEEIIKMLDEMRLIIKREIMPPPTSYKNRCRECEFRNFCNDIF